MKQKSKRRMSWSCWVTGFGGRRVAAPNTIVRSATASSGDWCRSGGDV